MIIGRMLWLLLFAAGGAIAQAPAPSEADKASGTNAIKAPAEAALGAKQVTTPAAQTIPKEPGKASKTADEARTASGSIGKTKAKPATAKPAAKKAKPATAKSAAKNKPKAASDKSEAKKAKPKPAPTKSGAKAKAKPKAKAAAKKPVADDAGASKSAPAAPAAVAPPQPAGRNLMGMREADARFQEGIELERRGDLQAALAAYQLAGESGHGMAQKKLGDFYGTGNAAVERDYETSLRWYERARQQGIEIPKPFTYPGVRR